MSDLYRRCGCRRPDGSPYSPSPERAKDDAARERQRASTCPKLLADPRHGSWGFLIEVGRDPGTGKRKQVRRAFATKREAQQERAKMLTAVAAGRFRVDQRMTLGEWLPKWLERRVRDGLRPSSERMYRRYVEQDLVPRIGRVKLADLRRHHVDKLVQDLTAAGRGATTVHRIHAVLSSALTAAERLELLDYNPASKVALPKRSVERKRAWEPEQLGEFLDAAAHHRIGVVFEVAVFTGLRRGELAGLQWGDVDLERRELRVRRQLVQLGGKVSEGPVKTAAGEDRVIAFGERTVAALLAWRLQQDSERATWAEAWQDGGWLFTRENGTPLRPAYISRIFEETVARAGVPPMPLHGLRHQHASNLLAQGVDMARISKRLGHATLAITADTYSHLLRGADREMAEAGESVVPPRTHGDRTVTARPLPADPRGGA